MFSLRKLCIFNLSISLFIIVIITFVGHFIKLYYVKHPLIVYLSVYLSIYLSICQSVMFVCLAFISQTLNLLVYVSLFCYSVILFFLHNQTLSVSRSLSEWLFAHISIFFSVYLYVCLPVCLSLSLAVCLSISLSPPSFSISLSLSLTFSPPPPPPCLSLIYPLLTRLLFSLSPSDFSPIIDTFSQSSSYSFTSLLCVSFAVWYLSP